MTGIKRRRSDHEDVVDAMVERWLADCPPLSAERKLLLSRLVTPPRRSITATGQDGRDPLGGDSDAS